MKVTTYYSILTTRAGFIPGLNFYLNLVFTIPECLQNSIKWSLPVKHTFLLLYLMYKTQLPGVLSLPNITYVTCKDLLKNSTITSHIVQIPSF